MLHHYYIKQDTSSEVVDNLVTCITMFYSLE